MVRTLCSHCQGPRFNPTSHATWPNKKLKKKAHVGQIKYVSWGFPGGAVVENLPANAGDTGSSPGLGRSHMPQSN